MKNIFSLIFLIFISNFLIAQDENSSLQIRGNFETNLQSYFIDSSIGAIEPTDERVLNNAYLNIRITKGDFTSGLRYESYLNALKDYDSQYKGNGIPFKFATFASDGLEITVGNYYEQFGSGLVLRTYEDKGLGVDNALDGLRLKYSPFNGIYLTSLIGKSRTYFDYSDGIIRGADAEIILNDIKGLENSKIYSIIGASFVSRFQSDNNPSFVLPENVAAFAARANLQFGNINYYGEYAHKINDPVGSMVQSENNYANGKAIVNNISYSQKGLGITFESHFVDHMEFRSERAKKKEYIINYIPTLSKQHTYTLLSLYPCATQPEGEFGFNSNIFYKIPKNTLLGGKYGTKLNVNFARSNSISGGTSFLNDIDSLTHNAPLFKIKGETLYFSDFNIEINKKINRDIKGNFVLSKQTYNRDVLEGKTIGEYGIITSTIAVADISYKIKKGHTIRMELQTLRSEDDPNAEKNGDGDWHMLLAEYTISPNWFVSIQDMYNYGNYDEEKRLHYVNTSLGFLKGANRFAIGYGKKRAGIFCVGGICKEVPSSNGFSLNVSSSF
tara:strand:- start:48 stop:1718 length:1671 start_codon:yes stop_codon:yes gene_type:complete